MNKIISPVYGKVVYIEEYNSTPKDVKNNKDYFLNEIFRYYKDGCKVIGIFMDISNPHQSFSPDNV